MPDLGKLNEISSKINTTSQQVEDNWQSLLRISQNPKPMRLYGKFIQEIMNDKVGGEELLKKARLLMSNKDK